MKNYTTRNILVCPLYWGAGHATRVQAVAYNLKKRGHRIIIAAPSALHFTFDRQVADELVTLWSPPVAYPPYLPLYLGVLLQMPLLFAGFIYDRFRLPGIIRRYNISLVISDNRFGLWSRRAYSVFITHQVRVALPRPFGFATPFVSSLHRSVAGRYDECWIPDLPGEDNLSGMLSHNCKLPKKTRYIGILSRHVIEAPSTPEGRPPFTLALLSGPEPRRTILEDIISSRKDLLPGRLIIVAGRPGDEKEPADNDILRYPWLDGALLFNLMAEAQLIICRSGYSTIMDLFSIGKTALLVPTPGQPEQEALAGYLSEKYGFAFLTQKQLAGAVSVPVRSRDFTWKGDNEGLLDEAIDDLLRTLP
ncbi:MAG: glycosyltransferase [Bacteroidales bacterium]|nr:glycosyltransferase [Bacteroidales bacterium]